MSERDYSQEEERTEASELNETKESPEARELEQATQEPAAHVEATRDHQEAEVIEASVTALIDEASTAPIDPPGGNIDPIEQTDIPGTHEGAAAAESGGDPEGDEATPINLPGPQDEISATPINTPGTTMEDIKLSPDDVKLDPEIDTTPEGLTEDPIRELDVQLPEHDLKQPEGNADVGTEMKDFMPERGSLTGADGKPLDDGKYGDGLLGDDFGIGSGGPGDLTPEGASDHPDIIPGTDSPFIPGKGPNAGVETSGGGMKDDKLEKFLADEAAGKAFSQRSEEMYRMSSPIQTSGMPKDDADVILRAGDGTQKDPPGASVPQIPDSEQPPPPKKTSAASPDDPEGGGSGKAEISDHSQQVMDESKNPDQISITTADDLGGSETPDRILPQFAERVEQAMKRMRQWVAPEMKARCRTDHRSPGA